MVEYLVAERGPVLSDLGEVSARGTRAPRVLWVRLLVVRSTGLKSRWREDLETLVRYLGIDLAWGEGSASRPANRSGVVALQPSGEIIDAGWTIGLDATAAWVEQFGTADCMLFVDAPLVVTNSSGQRLAEKQVGQRYGRWKVSANSTNLGSPRQAGVRLRERLEAAGWRYADGVHGPPADGQWLSECYPYTTIVGAQELGYDDERPRYKRAPRGMPAAESWPLRTNACDELIRRVAALSEAEPPMDLASHSTTQQLVDEPSPARPAAYKQREDLLDAAICAWTAALWHHDGTVRCQVLGIDEAEHLGDELQATIIAPARDSQRPAPVA